MKKKISILTFFFSHNYGAVLQAYAMSQVLISEGYEVEFIDLRTHSANLKPTFPKSVRDIFILYKYISIKHFLKKYFPPKTKPIRNLEELKQYPFDSDLFLVGSDQVWGLKHIGDSYPAFFFDFVPNHIPKIAFAASFGISEWSNEISALTTNQIRLLLEKFNYIGVREQSGVDICKNLFNISANHVLDPTLLLGSFDTLIGNIASKPTAKLFRYFINQNQALNKEIDTLTKSVVQNIKLTKWNDIRNIKYKNPAQWLKLIATSSFVLTDSFHVCCFSIMFRKPFIIFITKNSVSTRITELLNELGLSDRIIYNSNELSLYEIYKHPIDFDMVHSKLQKIRLESISELRKALKCLK
jgi:hypothetical protein